MSPSGTTRVVYTSGWYRTGEEVIVKVTGLEVETEYQLEAYGVNYAGQGPASGRFSVGTGQYSCDVLTQVGECSDTDQRIPS